MLFGFSFVDFQDFPFLSLLKLSGLLFVFFFFFLLVSVLVMYCIIMFRNPTLMRLQLKLLRIIMLTQLLRVLRLILLLVIRLQSFVLSISENFLNKIYNSEKKLS